MAIFLTILAIFGILGAMTVFFFGIIAIIATLCSHDEPQRLGR